MNLLQKLDIDIEFLTTVVDENPSLRGMLTGYIAEYKLKEYFEDWGLDICKVDDHTRSKSYDFLVTCYGIQLRIEVKSLQTNSIIKDGYGLKGYVQCDASDKRLIHVRSDDEAIRAVSTTCLEVGTFDILAVGLFGFRNQWEFGFALNRDLPRTKNKKYPEDIRGQLLKTNIPISWPLKYPFTRNALNLFKILAEEKDELNSFEN